MQDLDEVYYEDFHIPKVKHKSMITIEELKSKAPLFLNDWSGVNRKEVLRDFNEEDKENVNILLASYTYQDYSGSAYVLFEEKGELYEVHGGNCSCYGLENQWEKETVVLKELVNRVTNGTFGYSEFRNELRTLLNID